MNQLLKTILIGVLVGLVISIIALVIYTENGHQIGEVNAQRPNWFSETEPVELNGSVQQSDNYNGNFTITVNPQ
jgi:hypothetical protein